MMLHQDGSTHEWVPGCQWDLIVTLDDATSEIYSAFFVEEEGTLSSFQGVREVIDTKGLFSSLYTDRGSHYWYTEAGGGRVDKTRLTQVHRALQQLGITLIPAYSPEARGRSERMFRTLQDRLPKELAFAGITEMAAANRYLREHFLPAFNRRFAVRGRRNGHRVRPVDRAEPRRSALRARRAGRGQRQYGAVSGQESAASDRHAPVPLCEGHGARARVSGGRPGGVSWATVFGPIPQADGQLLEPDTAPTAQRSDSGIGQPTDRRL